MAVQVYVRDVAFPPIPPELVPYLSQLMQAAGHRIRWEPVHQAMLVDSPLDGRLVRCLITAPHSRMAALIATGLSRWLQMAGAAVVQGAGRRADVTVVVRAEPLPPGVSPSVHLASRPRHWFARRDSLATVVAGKLCAAVRLPVNVSHGWAVGKNVLQVLVRAPEHERLAQLLSKAIWQGLMAHFCEGVTLLDVALPATLSAPLPEPKPAPQPELQTAPQPELQPTPRPEPQPTPRPEPQPAPRPEPPPAPRTPRVIWSSDDPPLHQPIPAPHRPQSGTPAVRAASWSADSRH